LNLAFQRRMNQIRQRWWVVLVVAVFAVLMAALSSLLAHPTYTGKSALVLTSLGRAPEQDALMVTGYSTLFNDPATILRLRATKKIPEDVTFEARTAAASPILIIEATADDPKVAQDAAQDIAEAFREDINSVRQTGNEGGIADLERQLKELNPFAADGSTNPYYTSLQERIDNARSDTTNQLQTLQLRAGVTKSAPNIVFNLVLGAVGGLLLGTLTALGLAALSTRLTNSADLRDKTGVEPLVEVPNSGSVELDRLREDRLRTLANIVSLEDLPKSTVITLTDSRGVRGARDLAEVLAKLSAQQGYRTVLVYADNDASQPADGAGFNDALADSNLVRYVLKDGDVESLKILPAGEVVADRYSRVTRERIVAVLDELRTGADTIVVAAPSIADTPETQLVCAAADLTILVVARGSSRAGDVTSAAEALAKAHAVLLGAVLIDGTNGQQRGRGFARSGPPGASANQRTRGVGVRTHAA
jgi:capsular polysaccharide biosynthesis protein